MKPIGELLSELRGEGVKLWTEGDSLRYSAPKGTLTEATRNNLRSRKAEIVQYLNRVKQASDSTQTFQAITRIPRDGNLPLSFAQQRLWFLDRLEGNNAAYNLPIALQLTGRLDISALEKSFNEIVRRHETMRATFGMVDGSPSQEIAPELTATLPIIDLQHLAEKAERDAEARRLAKEENSKLFDLTKAPLWRVLLLKLGEEEHILVWTIHHIVSDGWSIGVFIRELAALYEAFAKGEVSPLPELPIQYVDFASWHRKWLEDKVLETQISYWKQQLAGAPPVHELPLDRPRPPLQTFSGSAEYFELDADVAGKLKELTGRTGASLFMTLLAGFATLIFRYSGQEDVVIGSSVANRKRRETESLIGFFVNLLVLRTNVAGNPSFLELLARTRQVTLDAQDRQDVPFDKLVDALQPERNMSHSPLCQAMFTLRNVPMPTPGPGLSWNLLEFDTGVVRFDLELHMWEVSGGLGGCFAYNTDLFDASTIERMAKHFQVLLGAIAANPERPVSELPLLGESDRHRLLFEWNDTRKSYSDKCVHQLFEARAEETPDAIAVVFEDQQLTYRELNCRANKLGRYLQSLGVGADVLTGICVDRSLEMVVAVLAILKAGGAYLPLDPNYPKQRLAFMLEDAAGANGDSTVGANGDSTVGANGRSPLLLTQKKLLAQLPEGIARVVCLDESWEPLHESKKPPFQRGVGGIFIDYARDLIDSESEENLTNVVAPENLAYAIYTSGSTSKPKGVAIAHRSLVNAYMAWEDAYQLSGSTTSHLQMASFSFDVCSGDIVRALCSGAKLVISPREYLLEPAKLYELMREQKVDCAEFVPAVMRNLVQYLQKTGQNLSFMRVLAVGSDSWYIKEYRELQQLCGSETRLVNSYGASEATIDSSYFEGTDMDLPGDRLVPIGRPFTNTQLYILDRSCQPVPIGVAGELHIGGPGLARGYLNRPDLTSSRFIPNPFSAQPGERLYKTGDLARYLADGNIELLGRIDNQVKIRGFRIELGEIESELAGHQAVRETAIAVRGNADEKRLVAYVVPAPDSQDWNESADEMHAEQVSGWEGVFDDIYKKDVEEQELKFCIRGWEDSDTRAPIPDEVVREWLELTVSRILSLRPTRVLELGCGGGLTLFRVAPHCDRYHATDLSKSALGVVRSQLDLIGPDLPVTLEQRPAHDLDWAEPNSFDAVAIVSVMQYFPSVSYLLQVLEGAAKAVEPGGFIFLADVRSLPLLEAFHTSVQLRQAPSALSYSELKQRVQKQLSDEKQLVVDPEFFLALKQHIPKIGCVQILLERGWNHNELTKFRYDVILHIGDRQATNQQIEWLDWKQDAGKASAKPSGISSVNQLRQLLVETEPEILGIAGVPNARLTRDVKALELLSEMASESGAKQTVAELRQALEDFKEVGVDPEEFWALSEDLPYRIDITWYDSSGDGRYNVLLRRHSAKNVGTNGDSPSEDAAKNVGANGNSPSGDAPPLPWPERAPSRKPWSHFTNNPMHSEFVRQLVPQLRKSLQHKLPEHMIPGAFVMLEEMPLTPNGKIDRRALPDPEAGRRELATTYKVPQTEAERRIAEIWQEVLQVENVGIYDNFFELGGHSLLMVKAHSKLRDVLGQEVSMVQMFNYPTIQSLAKYLSQGSSGENAVRPSRDLAKSRSDRLSSTGQSQLRQEHRAKNK